MKYILIYVVLKLAHSSCDVEGAVLLGVLCRKYLRTANSRRPDLYIAAVK